MPSSQINTHNNIVHLINSIYSIKLLPYNIYLKYSISDRKGIYKNTPIITYIQRPSICYLSNKIISSLFFNHMSIFMSLFRTSIIYANTDNYNFSTNIKNTYDCLLKNS